MKILASPNAFRFAAAAAVALFTLVASELQATARAEAAPATPDLRLVGQWFVAAKDVVIDLTPCLDTPGAICGHIAWIKDPYDASGHLRRDVKNPDHAQRNNLLCGTSVLWGLQSDPKKADRWRDGKAYLATRGFRVYPRVDLVDPNTIRVRGSIGPFWQAETWTRADPKGDWRCLDHDAPPQAAR